MLPDSGIACFSFSCYETFRSARWLLSLKMNFVSNTRRKMLFYSILQSLGSASYVARITLARKFIHNGTLLCGRNAILLNGWKGLLCTINNTYVNNMYIIYFSVCNEVLTPASFLYLFLFCL